MTRLFWLNAVMVLVGGLSMHATEVMDDKLTQVLGLPYYLLWMCCVGMAGYIFNGSGMLLVTRRTWRRMPDAEARYAQHGLYRGLPWPVRCQLLATALLTVCLASVISQVVFTSLLQLIQADWLPRRTPPFRVAVFDLCYGVAIAYVFEYFQDRTALSETRERRAQQLSTQAQLNLLRSQLDPHMLFNTLSNLYELIDQSPDQARHMLSHLIGFLRATLAGSRITQHALSEEFKLASDYLALMQIRMGDRLQVDLDMPAHLAQVSVPAMLLQPLVENAIKHGLEPRKEGGQLAIAARAEQDELILQVRNCGPGRGHAQAVPAALTEPGGFGLQYVRDRLAALYGDAASIDFHQHTQDNLTQVTLRMPLQRFAPLVST